MADEPTLGLQFLTVILILLSLTVTWYRKRALLDAIPTIGYSDPILSYFSAFRFSLIDGFPMVKEGYEKYGSSSSLFKVPTFGRWVVIPTSAEIIQEIKNAPDNILSVRVRNAGVNDALDLLNKEDDYSTVLIHSKLTRNIADTFDQINDETVKALGEYFPTTSEEWDKISMLPAVRHLVCRVSSRVFVGTPLCRDRDYQDIALNVTTDIFIVARIFSISHKLLKPIVLRVFSQVPSRIRRTVELIKPTVEERFAKMEELGGAWDSGDAPNDLLMWMMNEAKGVERSPEGLARRLIGINFASIHSTSNFFTLAFYRLLSHPEYIEPLRQEIEAVIAEEGWTRVGIAKMHKLDSFVREALRIDCFGTAMTRVTLRPFTLSNGVTLPTNTGVAFPQGAIHKDEEIYTNAEEFDGFRFLRQSDTEEGVAATAHKSYTISREYLPFGLGRHACPGRFFAINVIKALLAHIIAEYDFKFEEGKGVPRQRLIGTIRIPGNADVLFRKRQK